MRPQAGPLRSYTKLEVLSAAARTFAHHFTSLNLAEGVLVFA